MVDDNNILVSDKDKEIYDLRRDLDEEKARCQKFAKKKEGKKKQLEMLKNENKQLQSEIDEQLRKLYEKEEEIDRYREELHMRETSVVQQEEKLVQQTIGLKKRIEGSWNILIFL